MKKYTFLPLAILLLSGLCSFMDRFSPLPPLTVLSPTPAPTTRPTLESDNPVLNIRYSDEPSSRLDALCLDIYPANGTNLPVVIFVHGGGWFRGDKSSVDLKPAAFNSRGYVFISVNYRLIPEVGIIQQIQDVSHAIAWVKRNISGYGGDPKQIILLGHSAGAHIVALLGTDETYFLADGLDLEDIKGIISLDTQTYDLVKLLKNLNHETGGEVYWETFGRDPEFWKQLSPTWHVSPYIDIPPFFIAYTGEKQSRAIISTHFYTTLVDAGIPAMLFPVSDKTHGQLNRELGLSNDRVTTAIFTWLDQMIH